MKHKRNLIVLIALLLLLITLSSNMFSLRPNILLVNVIMPVVSAILIVWYMVLLSRKEYKVIGVSNFNDEMISDKLIADGLTKGTAIQMANEMNEDVSDYSIYFYKAVPMEYKLYKYEP